MRTILGVFFCCLPFIVISSIIVLTGGWRELLVVIATLVAIVGSIVLGVSLL